jgi:hypothetical protein
MAPRLLTIPALALAALSAVVVGCGRSEDKQAKANTENVMTQSTHEGQPGNRDHSGWWCAEHGVPEEICGLCNAKFAGECKKKGDWCKEHERPESQCFICHPDKKEQFAAQYRAKYGKEPPPIEDEQKKQ